MTYNYETFWTSVHMPKFRDAQKSELDAQRELLDSLMGLNRNNDRLNQVKSFRDERVCKFYLTGMCPHDLFVNTKMDEGPCEKLHSDAFKADFEKNGDPGMFDSFLESEFQMRINEAEKIIKRARARVEEDKIDEEVNPDINPDIIRIHAEMAKIISDAERDVQEGLYDKVQEILLGRYEGLLKEKSLVMNRINDLKKKAQSSQDKKLRVCDVCGSFLSIFDSDKRLADHFVGKQHIGFQYMRDMLETIRKRRDERRERDRAGAGRRGNSRDRDRDRDRERDRDRTEAGAMTPEIDTEEAVDTEVEVAVADSSLCQIAENSPFLAFTLRRSLLMLVILALVLSSVVCTNCLVVLRHGNDHATKTFLPQSRCLSRFNRKTQSRLRAEHYFTEYDKYGTEKLVQFDPKSGTLQSVQAETEQQEAKSNKLAPLLFSSFIPTGDLSPDYYRFSAWRVVQRLIGSTNNVFGTQALLLALGLRKDKIGLAAASSWVLKDALGKVSRIVFASKFGRRFDVDTKKWRFRASLLYSLGTALEILTFLFPSFFIISAAIATAFKQMAMLSNSSTRNAIYKSFSRNADNIGDITAKGEAQIAVIDIFGLALGITIAKVMNQSRWRVIAAFVLLSALDFLAVYREIRSVVFNTLNYERANLVLSELIPLLADPPSPMISSTLSPPPSPASQLDNPSSATVMPSPEEIRISSDDKTDI
eukprot:gene34922-42291_t